jgi:hypothetical protein
MANAILTIISWGLFYLFLFLYIFWIFVERAFFTGSDPEHWDSHAHADEAGSAAEHPRPIDAVPSATPLRRAA